MKPATNLLVLLFAVLTILAELCCALAFPLGRVAKATAVVDVAIVLSWGLAFGQLAIVAAWFAMRMGRIWFRLLVLTLSFGLVSGMFVESAKQGPPNLKECIGFLTLYVAQLLMVLIVFRLSGWRLADSVGEPIAHAPGAKQWQFSTRGIMIAMTLACLTTGIVRWIKPDDWQVVLLYCAGLVPNALVALWVGWSSRPLPYRIVAGALTVGIVGVVLGKVERPQVSVDWTVMSIVLLQSGYITLGSIVARIGGWRLERS